MKNTMKTLALLLLAVGARAGVNYDLQQTASSATMKLSGVIKLAASSGTSNSFNLTLNGVGGSITAASSVTASALFGDGSHLTGISGSLSGGTSGYVPKWTGAATQGSSSFYETSSSDTYVGAGGFRVFYGLTATTATTTQTTTLVTGGTDYAFSIGTTQTSPHQAWVNMRTMRVGANATQGNHDNGILMVGVSGSTTAVDILDPTGGSSHNRWGIYVSPTFAVREDNTGSDHHYGFASDGVVSVSTTGANIDLAEQIGIFVNSGQTDGHVRVLAGYGIKVASITYNTGGGGASGVGNGQGIGILNLSNYYASNNDTYIALGAGVGSTTGAIRLTNTMQIRQALNGGASDANLMGITSGDSFQVGDTTMNNMVLQNNALYLGMTSAQGSMIRGTLTVPYGIVAGTATFSGAAVMGGLTRLLPRTKAQLSAITPSVGDSYTCSDCTLTYNVVVGTGATAGGFREAGTSHGPQ